MSISIIEVVYIRLRHYLINIRAVLICAALPLLIGACGQTDTGITVGKGAAYPQPGTAAQTQGTAYPQPGTLNEQPQAAQAKAPYPPPETPEPTLPPLVFRMEVRVLGVVFDQNLKILHVEPNSAAKKAGVQVGDVLDSLEDIPIKGHVGDVKNKIAAAPKSKGLRLKVKRGGKDVEVNVVPAPPQFDNPNPGKPIPTATPVQPSEGYL